MKLKKMPPKEKIHEAISALADDRIEINKTYAYITSSDNSKKYTVTWNDDKSIFTSNDNATYWQGYPGYPILAVLLSMGTLKFPKNLIPYFKNINWNELNKTHKRNYTAAAEEALENIDSENKQKISVAIDTVYNEIGNMNFSVKRGKEAIIK